MGSKLPWCLAGGLYLAGLLVSATGPGAGAACAAAPVEPGGKASIELRGPMRCVTDYASKDSLTRRPLFQFLFPGPCWKNPPFQCNAFC